MSIIGTIYEDVTTEVIGKIGSWQWLVTFISTVLMVPAMFNQYEDIFMLYPENVVCLPSQGAAVVNSSLCSYTVMNNGTEEVIKCSKWNIRLMSIIWLKKSWMVFCDQPIKLQTAALVCRFGLVFGCVMYGVVSDSFGRKSAIIISVCTSMSLELTITFCDSQGWFKLFVFLKALFGSAGLFMGLLLICEIASNTWRSTLNTIVMVPRLLALVCTVPLANSAPNIETYSLITFLFCILTIILLRWCPESPQWLLFNRKIHYAEIILKKASEMNGIRLCGEFKIRPVNHRAYHCLDETTTCVGGLTTPNIRTIFLVTLTFWMVYYFMWSSLYLRVYSEDRSGGLLLKVFCFVVVFGCLTITASIKLAMKLRYLLMIHVVLTGAAIICAEIIHQGIACSVAFWIATAAGIIVHALILNITPRLFAINIRANIFGCCHACGQLGSTMSYIFHLFQPLSEVVFLFVTMGTTITLVGLCFLLPNIDGRELPDVLEDMDYYSELSKPLRWATQKTSSPSLEETEMRVYSFGSNRTNSHSETRAPAQSIGLRRLGLPIADFMRRKFASIKMC